MSASPKIEVFTRKYGGDDAYSWAVFAEGNPTPIVTGLSRAEARAEKVRVKAMLEERANRRTTM